MLVVLLGGLIMLVAMFLEDLIGLLIKHTRLSNTRLAFAHATWKASSTMQLHRLAHENLGLGSWKRTDEDIPVTGRGEMLGVFDVDDRRHVGMRLPSEEVELVAAGKEGVVVRGRKQYERVPSNL
jgi:hypothetical protein